MTVSRTKIDRRWALKGRLIALLGATLIFIGLGLDIWGGSWGWLGRILTLLGIVIGLAGAARLREDRKKHLRQGANDSL
ncbi:hypothetical protein [Caulobacter sp. Root487D2Y]|uniref:hypothetical protein n=1 Tax=Caulobacter sp. Root487D2Y TaxID=1736547 RepID=UPI000AEB8A45|nr:hypothetical protein [Caulobacter sp. Root487D2Y]